MTLSIDVAVESEAWASAGLDLEAVVQRAAEAATVVLPGVPDEAELSVMLCDDAAIQALNRQWRGKDTPTNVLSFPASLPPGLPGPRLLGDIVVAYGTTSAEAAQEGKSLEAHLTHLMVHGVLHLLDHDHDTAEEATAMEALETRILAGLGIADPYAGTEPAALVPT